MVAYPTEDLRLECARDGLRIVSNHGVLRDGPTGSMAAVEDDITSSADSNLGCVLRLVLRSWLRACFYYQLVGSWVDYSFVLMDRCCDTFYKRPH